MSVLDIPIGECIILVMLVGWFVGMFIIAMVCEHRLSRIQAMLKEQWESGQ